MDSGDIAVIGKVLADTRTALLGQVDALDAAINRCDAAYDAAVAQERRVAGYQAKIRSLRGELEDAS